MSCPCGSGDDLAECCGPYHAGTAVAPTALALMRSRYSAYALGDVRYVQRTWHHTTRPSDLVLDERVLWQRLHIVDIEAGGPDDTTGEVEFVARFRAADDPGLLRERSEFVRENGRWLYVRGTVDG